MEDLFTQSTKVQDIPEFSVSEISFEIKRFVETAFSRVKVKGEIFGAKRADSGHWYLSLKDENATLSAVVWRGVASNLSIKPEDGLEVVATGKITTFAGKSSYQMVIESMEVAGTGALLKLLEERKQAFAKEGLFDAIHKKTIPSFVQVKQEYFLVFLAPSSDYPLIDNNTLLYTNAQAYYKFCLLVQNHLAQLIYSPLIHFFEYLIKLQYLTIL